MRASRFYWRTLRSVPRDIASPVEGFAVQAGVIQRVAGGLYVLPPLGVRVVHNLEALVRRELESIGGQEIQLPILQRRELWESAHGSGRWLRFEPFIITAGPDARWCLSPTAEESMVHALAAAGTLSHRELPLLLYLIQPRFRLNRGARGLHRAQEYPMHEAYGLAASAAGAVRLSEALTDAYSKVLACCEVVYVMHTVSSGSSERTAALNFYVTGSTASDKTVDRCRDCGMFRGEPKAGGLDGAECAACRGPFVATPVLHVAQVTLLDQRYTSALGLGYESAGGERVPPWMCGGGIGLYRLLLATIDRHRENSGLTWPLCIAPFRVTLVVLDSREVPREEAERLHDSLEAAGLTVWWDDRTISAGVKLADADLLGSPVRVILGPRALATGSAEVVDRRSGENLMVALDGVVPAVTSLLAGAGR